MLLLSAILVVVMGAEPTGGVASLSNIVGWVAGIIFGGYWYGNKINGPGGQPIGFTQGILVALVIVAISIALILVLGLIMGGAATVMAPSG